jgi:CheY-like chemotaxis protein
MNKKSTYKKILLAEGFAPSRDVMTEILNVLGYEYQAASNGYEVILLIKNQSFDLILLDLELPQFDGFETIEHIRRNLDYPENAVPVVAMTNKDFSSEFNQTYKEEGFDGLIIKPFSLDELDLVIKEVLYHQKTSDENVFSE